MTLIEVMIVVAVLSVVLSSLCGVYITVGDEWQRQDGSRDCQIAASSACNRIGDYISQGVQFRFLKKNGSTDNNVLAVCLPADSAYGMYVPVPDNDQFKYQDGSWVVFYLSDSTGSYSASGNILWAATAAQESDIPDHIVPDVTWSLYPGSTRGLITPLSSVSFQDNSVDFRAVTVTAGAQCKAGVTTKTIQMSKTVCSRTCN